MSQKDRTEMEKKTFHAAETFNGRTEQLKEYLRRLGAGEALESVRADFVKQFSDVEASEIMQAEQKLLKEGTPLTEVQKLCDVHSVSRCNERRTDRQCGERGRSIQEENRKCRRRS